MEKKCDQCIHSSPIKKGKTACFSSTPFRKPERQTAGLKIADCRQCNWCMTRQTTEKLCSIEDDANPILRKVRDCDILILASPVYFSRLSGTMACFIDRTRCFMFGKNGRLALKGKIGVALAVNGAAIWGWK